ncbi:MAG: S8 family serine peptidase [Candidatus Margulisiibacteriota bacterium]
MKKIWLIFIWFLAISFLSFAYAEYVPGQIMVKFRPGVVSIPKGIRIASTKAASVRASSVSALNTKFRVKEIEQLNQKTLEIRPEWKHLADDYVLIFPEGEDVEKIAAEYKKDPNVISASPVSIVHAFATNPDDTHYVSGDQYGLTNISASLAWDRTTGSSSITIAVMDTGIDYNHEDFDGRVNLADAWDFVNNDSNPMDDHSGSHGTTVSGVIGATTNNGKGVAGVDWQAKILPIKVLDNNGEGSMVDIIQGLSWARAKGADVVNMSFGQYPADANLAQACLDAYNDGLVLVAAAGNGGVNWNTYPACLSTVVGVGAVNQNDQRSVWGNIDPATGQPQASNYGSWVDVCAPGTDIWTTSRNDSYRTSSGTSLACPFVAGLAGLIKAANSSVTNQQIMDKITSEADTVSTDQPIGKRINAYLAVAGLVGGITSPASNAYVKGTIDVYGSASGWDFSSYVLEALQNSSLVATIENSSVAVESGLLGSWDSTGVNGEHSLRLTVFSSGGSSEEASVAVYIDNTVPTAEISSPLNGATVSGDITIVGAAEDQYFNNYILSYGQGASPSSFVTIKEGYAAVSAATLATWGTSGLNGQYALKLTVSDKAGTTSTKTIVVNLLNTSPATKEAEPQAGMPIAYTSENPFERATTSEITFNYTLAGNFATRIYLFDLSGNLIWQNSYSAGENGGKSGENNPSWDGKDVSGVNVPNGVYLYQIIADQKPLARGKIIVLN